MIRNGMTSRLTHEFKLNQEPWLHYQSHNHSFLNHIKESSLLHVSYETVEFSHNSIINYFILILP